jgi:hypothetical protein
MPSMRVESLGALERGKTAVNLELRCKGTSERERDLSERDEENYGN